MVARMVLLQAREEVSVSGLLPKGKNGCVYAIAAPSVLRIFAPSFIGIMLVFHGDNVGILLR